MPKFRSGLAILQLSKAFGFILELERSESMPKFQSELANLSLSTVLQIDQQQNHDPIRAVIVCHFQDLQFSFQVVLLCLQVSFPRFKLFRGAASMVSMLILQVERSASLSMNQSKVARSRVSMAFGFILEVEGAASLSKSQFELADPSLSTVFRTDQQQYGDPLTTITACHFQALQLSFPSLTLLLLPSQSSPKEASMDL